MALLMSLLEIGTSGHAFSVPSMHLSGSYHLLRFPSLSQTRPNQKPNLGLPVVESVPEGPSVCSVPSPLEMSPVWEFLKGP